MTWRKASVPKKDTLMRAAWALAQSLLLLDLKTGEVYER